MAPKQAMSKRTPGHKKIVWTSRRRCLYFSDQPFFRHFCLTGWSRLTHLSSIYCKNAILYIYIYYMVNFSRESSITTENVWVLNAQPGIQSLISVLRLFSKLVKMSTTLKGRIREIFIFNICICTAEKMSKFL